MGDPLKEQVATFSELRPDVRWFYSEDGTEAVGIGHGFVWNIAANSSMVTRMQAYLGEWSNGIKQAGIIR